MVSLVKDLLRNTLRKTSLNYEEMTTVLCDCESIINVRPITYIPDEKNSILPISLEMFLKDIHEDRVPDLDHLQRISLNQRLQYPQRLLEHIRDRFRSEYLGQLSRHSKIKTVSSVLKVGDAILVSNDLEKKLCWPLARVEELIPGNDGKVRTARVKTATGVLVRPLQRLILLEASFDDQITISARTMTVPSIEKNSGDPTADEESQVLESNLKQNSNGQTPEEPIEDIPAPPCTSLRDGEQQQTRSGRVVKTPQRFLTNP